MSRTSVTSRDLAAFLSAQLAPELAGTGFHLSADGSDVVLRASDGDTTRSGAAAILDDADGRTFSERVATAARAVLSHLQDVVSTATGRPWPGSGSELSLPDAHVEDGSLVAWFGDADRPVWSSAPFPTER
ncbi:hypothetical protein [Actinomycetospora sp. CA-084318]|uniref:hypothetical protein n=1 Tax=Actinomycetospora sp. CA-084318 TaxID=3239892 RepID=UPI003D97AED5